MGVNLEFESLQYVSLLFFEYVPFATVIIFSDDGGGLFWFLGNYIINRKLSMLKKALK